jgi:hypothetical protein
MFRAIITTLVFALVVAAAAPAAAQDEATLRSFFEGRRVTVRIDMPATSDGVDVWADSSRSIDYERYGERLKDYGVAIRAGESSTVTLVKMKKDLIEFQLGGGGFGTFGDDTSTSVYMPRVEKSSREKELERLVRTESDSAARRRLNRELDELREDRERENRRIDAMRVLAEEHKKEQIGRQRLAGGSRFNLRYDGAVPSGITPTELMAALAEYVEFSRSRFSFSDERASDGLPRKGMSRAEAERAFGPPVHSSGRREGRLSVATLQFERDDRRITADFVEDVLIRFEMTTR